MADDNDDLDNLFGAFDGDDGGDEENLSASEESHDEGEQNQKDADNDDGDETDAVPAKSVVPSATTLAAALSRPISASTATSGGPGSQLSPVVDGAKNGTTAAADSAAKKSDVDVDGRSENKEVSTGTSHDKSIRSYSARPENLDPSAIAKDDDAAEEPRPPAKVYPFKLDPFQQTAVDCIERNESVLVAAHTSAGKTAVAEYAVAKSLRDGQRVVYTSPIKALSNQKYRDLCEEFQDVGLMTGDITINPGATCLVMTTEILRSMLYRGSEVMREVAWVIYDEVHYMRDKERGVVWEESIVLLPHRVRFVFLSATIPNARQFVDWIAKIHHQPCHVVYTNYRPVPLQHYIFPQSGEGLHLVVDEKGKFREANFQKAMSSLQSGSGADAAAGEAMLNSGGGGGRKRKRTSVGGNRGGKGGKGQSTDLHRIVKLVMERNLNPVIIFSFSKKDCEKYALELHREDYTDEVEKDLISQVYKNAIESLSEDDRKLPQVEALLPLLKRGIGIHHGGLLPILKEIVEILFSEGLIKALFATETFSIGINMPAKTVVFTNTRKWDGTDFRWVTSGEYIQMSGRAGRRGKDDRGIVIQMLDEKMEPAVCKGILYGDPDPLNSSYRISYNMLLNMVRVEDVDPEYILRASFRQYQVESEAPALEAQAESLEEEAKAVVVGTGHEDEDAVGEYFQMDRQLLLAQRKMMKIVQRPEHILPFLKGKGRLLDVSIDGEYFGWGVLNSYKCKSGTGSAGSAGKAAADAGGPMHTIDVLLPCVDRHFDDKTEGDAVMQEDASNIGLLWRGTIGHCRPARPGNEEDKKLTSWRVFSVGLSDIDRISAVRIFMPQDITPPEARVGVAKSLVEVARRFPEGLPLLDPVKDLKIKSSEFEKLLGRAAALKERLAAHKLTTEANEEDRAALVGAYGRKIDLRDRARALRDEARSCKGVIMRDELRKMKRVLRQLGHVDANGVIQMKGRTACEINTANELVVVEMVFTGLFNDLSVEQSVAVLSCLTFDERNKDEGDPAEGLKSYLSSPFYKLQECARTVAKASIACKIELDEDEFIEKFNPGMMEAVFAWCKGAKFVDVQKLTGTFEGTTIRTLRRLEELVRQLANAAKSIGNHELQTKFEKGSELLKRDIVFCSSLYL